MEKRVRHIVLRYNVLRAQFLRELHAPAFPRQNRAQTNMLEIAFFNGDKVSGSTYFSAIKNM